MKKQEVFLSIFTGMIVCIVLVWVMQRINRIKMPGFPSVYKEEKRKITAGIERVDLYDWMRNKKSRRVISHLKRENEYTDQYFLPLQHLQEQIYQEMISHIAPEEQWFSFQRDGFIYYYEYRKGNEYPVWYRKRGKEIELLIDENERSGSSRYYNIGYFEVSPSGRWLAFSEDFKGDNAFTLRFKDMKNGKVTSFKLPYVDHFCWSRDGRYIVYVSLHPQTYRPYRVYAAPFKQGKLADPILLYEEKDERYNVSITISAEDSYIFIYSMSSNTSEVRFVKAENPLDTPVIFWPREEGLLYDIDYAEGVFFVRHNADGRINFTISVCAPSNTAKDAWKEMLPYNPEHYITDFLLIKNKLIVEKRINGKPTIEIINREGYEVSRVNFEEAAYSVYLSGNEQYDTDKIWVNYESFVTPLSKIEIEVNTLSQRVIQQKKVAGKYHPEQYTMEWLTAISYDNTEVPVLVVYKKGLRKHGNNPCVLEGYGAYGVINDPYFSVVRLSLLDRGFVYATAMVRGGSEKGYDWYLKGKMQHKKNTFYDFIAAAECLIKEGYTSSSRMACRGGSAGGLLVGAVLNMRPDLFRAAIAEVPFVDVLNTMSDPTLPLTTQEYEEWGNPHKREEYEWIARYSPYDNVRCVCYPSIYASAGFYDSQVPYWEPAKWIAKIREYSACRRPYLLRVLFEAGHAGKNGRYRQYREEAEILSFLIQELSSSDS